MNPFPCPFCGPRPIEEFAFHKTLPNVDGGEFESVYLRRDSAVLSVEHWQHRYGCRAWLEVRRDPSGSDVHEVRLLTGPAAAGDAPR